MSGFIILCLAFMAIGVAGLFVGVFLSGRRRIGWAVFLLGLGGFSLSAIAYGLQIDGEAKSAGFLSYSDKVAAKKEGITDPEAWRGRRAKLAELNDAGSVERMEEVDEQQTDDVAVQCRADLICWGDKAFVVASVKCPRLIEQHARYSARWVDGLLDTKFSDYRWADREAGIVTVLGDRVLFQNGFGADERMTYECDVDPASAMVIDVRVVPGMLRSSD